MLERLFSLSARVPHDKAMHALVGLLLGFLGLLHGPCVSVLLVVMAAVGKEVYDAHHPGHQADPLDALATVLGAAPVWAAYFLGGWRG